MKVSHKKKYEVTQRHAVEQWGKHHPRVMTWLAKIQAKDAFAYRLYLFCRAVKLSPEQLLALKDDPKNLQAEYLLDKFVADESLGITNNVKVSVVIAVKSFFAQNYRELARKSGQITAIKVKPYRRHTKEELMKIYRACLNPRDRALITFTWSTGIAKESLSLIQWSDLEPGWEKVELPHISLTSAKIKGHGIRKYAGTEQHTFLTPEAKADLLAYKDYLERVKGVKLNPQDNIWRQIESPFKPLSYAILSNIPIIISKRAGVPFSWHDARRYVETALEGTKINPNWARKIRGRKVRGEENPYSRPAIEELRKAYKEAVPFLQFTQPTDLTEIQRRQEMIERIQQKLLTGQDLDAEEKAYASSHPFRMTKKTPKKPLESAGAGYDPAVTERFEQISENKLLEHLRSGWTVEHRLQSGDVIVKKR